MRIQHNIMAMNAYRNYTNNTSAVAKNLEKLSSGYRINRAGDDAAGLAISEKMRAQITGLSAAQKNVKDGISLVKTAEGATQEIHDMLNRMVYLAEQSANGTYQDEVDREAITNEFNQLKSEIDRIADSSNFNGIKLLDGSLAKEQVATKIDVTGLYTVKSQGTKGKYITGATSAPAADITGAKVDDTFKFTASLEDGTSKTVTMTVKYDTDGKKAYLESDDGTRYDLSGSNAATTQAGGSTVSGADLNTAFAKELTKSNLGKEYNISSSATVITMEAKEVGTKASQVKAFDYEQSLSGTRTKVDIGVSVAAEAVDDGIEIDPTKITEYDGTNYDDAVFTINGKKFVVLTNQMDGASTGTANQEYLRAAAGLGSDVTVLVGGVGGLQKPTAAAAPVTADSANSNFDQNMKAIAEATGLKATDASSTDNDAHTGNATGTVAAGAGFRLSLGGKATEGKGLVLQIGDTSDDFNQLRVSVGDMHAKALGIDKLDLGTQAGAQAAVAKIKDAINYVSQERGTLGATQNRLEHTQNNLSVMKENIQDAESSIRDTDIAEEMMAYTKNNILVQSAQAMLAQANQVPQGVLQLLG